MHVIRVVCLANGQPTPHAGQYVKWVDWEAPAHRKIGEFTLDPAEAKRFATAPEAFAFWKTVRKRDGLRPDGKPDRPLTAFTVEILPEEDLTTIVPSS